MADPILRILDANLNRARDAARVVEEFFRFVLNDRSLAASTKELRHALQSAEAELPAAALLAARQSSADVGMTISTPSEAIRQDARAVVDANFARLSESLRVLEEYGKTISASFAAQIEALRYSSYRLESALPYHQHLQALAAARVMVILGGPSKLEPQALVDQLVGVGQRVFQIREKGASDRDVLSSCERWMAALRRQAGLTIVINDRADLALALEADGVHLGQDDLPIAEAKKLLGPARVVGQSTHSLLEIEAAEKAGADYLGAGAIFPTTTKEISHLGGLAWGKAASDSAKLPLFAIGGINLENIEAVAEAGIRRVAIASAITQSAAPGATLQALYSALASS